jgi:hypothetical protein
VERATVAEAGSRLVYLELTRKHFSRLNAAGRAGSPSPCGRMFEYSDFDACLLVFPSLMAVRFTPSQELVCGDGSPSHGSVTR